MIEPSPINISKTQTDLLLNVVTEWHYQFIGDGIRERSSPGMAQRIEVFIAELRLVRWGLVSSEDRLAELYNMVMPGVELTDNEADAGNDQTDDDIVDYVLNGVTYMKIRSCVNSVNMGMVLGSIVSAITWPNRSGVIDTAIQERSATHDFIKEIVENSPWFLFLFLLSMAPIKFSETYTQPGNGDT